ncbi:hypothetical protein LL394_000444 [Serratia marcescens]|uniref:hypothetical protein n=1 Tax=Serratia marcescens TaxID=615 RepID=UPI00339C4C9F
MLQQRLPVMPFSPLQQRLPVMPFSPLQQRLPVMPFSPRGVDLVSCILSFTLSNAARLSIFSKISIVGLALLYCRYDELPLIRQPISHIVSALHLYNADHKVDRDDALCHFPLQ